MFGTQEIPKRSIDITDLFMQVRSHYVLGELLNELRLVLLSADNSQSLRFNQHNMGR